MLFVDLPCLKFCLFACIKIRKDCFTFGFVIILSVRLKIYDKQIVKFIALKI